LLRVEHRQPGPKPSVDDARAVLLAAGWSMSGDKLVKDGKPLSILLKGSTAFGAGQYIRNVWTQVGVDVTCSRSTTRASARTLRRTFDASFGNANVSIPTPGAYVSRFIGPFYPQGTNYSRSRTNVGAVRRGCIRQPGEESCKSWARFQRQLWESWHLLRCTRSPGYLQQDVRSVAEPR